jgi:hypothetical protein
MEWKETIVWQGTGRPEISSVDGRTREGGMETYTYLSLSLVDIIMSGLVWWWLHQQEERYSSKMRSPVCWFRFGRRDDEWPVPGARSRSKAPRGRRNGDAAAGAFHARLAVSVRPSVHTLSAGGRARLACVVLRTVGS